MRAEPLPPAPSPAEALAALRTKPRSACHLFVSESLGPPLATFRNKSLDDFSRRCPIPALRSTRASVSALDRSLMPEGLEQTLSLQDMADLFAYLTSTNETVSSSRRKP